MTLLDLTTCLWIAIAATAIYVGLPMALRRLCRPGGPPLITLIAGLLLWTVVGITGLSAVSLVNSATVLALHAAYAVVVFAASHRCFDDGAQRLLRALTAVRRRFPTRRLQSQAVLARLASYVSGARPSSQNASRPHLIAFATLTAVVAATRLWPALLEARLFDRAGYQALVLVRLVADGPWPGVTLGAPAWSAALAILSAVDPAYVARFVPALLACALTWMLPRVVRGSAHRFDAAVVAVACWLVAGSGIAADSPWGSILSRQYILVGAYVAALFLLALLADTEREDGHSARRLLPAVAALVFSPPLGVAAAVALASPTRIRPGVLASTWVAVAVAGLNPAAPAVLADAATTLPLALALSAGIVCAALPRRIYFPERSSAVACGALVAVGGFTMMPSSRPLEHEEMARQTLRIMRQSAKGEWTIVAHDVPLLRGQRDGRVMPIPMFVACSSGPVFPECVAAQRTTTYVIVQKRPFDPSAVGDEQAALSAIERLVHATKGSHIDYEDGILRVYVVPAQPWAL